MNRERLEQLRKTYRDGLLSDVVPFWLQHGVDREHGGYWTCLDRDGSLVDTDKSVWFQGRGAWLFGELYNTVKQREEWLEAARLGIEFMERHCFDDDGRMFFHVTREGRPIRKRRYNFSESFAAIAFAEYAKATGSDRHRQKAIDLLTGYAAYHKTPGTMPPKFSDVRPMQGLAPHMIAIATAQEVRDAVGFEGATAIVDEAIETIRRYFVKPERRAVMESVGPGGEILDHFDGRLLNPGHAIEGAWFILHEACLRMGGTGSRRSMDGVEPVPPAGGDAQGLMRLGLDMLDWMWERGWDAKYGGLLYFRDLKNLPVQEYWHDMKFWWPQCEAIIATLMAYAMTGDAKYAEWHRLIHEWAHERFPDPAYGEWFGYLHRDGTLSTQLKGTMWKGPFHIPRMQLVCWRLTEELLGERQGATP